MEGIAGATRDAESLPETFRNDRSPLQGLENFCFGRLQTETLHVFHVFVCDRWRTPDARRRGTEIGKKRRRKQEEHELLRSQDNRPGAVEAQV
jgi:hypothetical protein